MAQTQGVTTSPPVSAEQWSQLARGLGLSLEQEQQLGGSDKGRQIENMGRGEGQPSWAKKDGKKKKKKEEGRSRGTAGGRRPRGTAFEWRS